MSAVGLLMGAGAVVVAFAGGWMSGRARLLRAHVVLQRAQPQSHKVLGLLRTQVAHAESFVVEAQRRTAAHEAGHVITAWGSPWMQARTATIVAESHREGLVTVQALGFPPAARAWDDMVLDLGGIAGEFALHGKARSGGAAEDLRSAVNNARTILAAGRVNPPWGVVTSATHLNFQAAFAEPIPDDVAEVLVLGYRRARYLIDQNPERFAAVVTALLIHRTLDADALALLRMGGHLDADG